MPCSPKLSSSSPAQTNSAPPPSSFSSNSNTFSAPPIKTRTCPHLSTEPPWLNHRPQPLSGTTTASQSIASPVHRIAPIARPPCFRPKLPRRLRTINTLSHQACVSTSDALFKIPIKAPGNLKLSHHCRRPNYETSHHWASPPTTLQNFGNKFVATMPHLTRPHKSLSPCYRRACSTWFLPFCMTRSTYRAKIS